jgi:hypothetical protein
MRLQVTLQQMMIAGQGITWKGLHGLVGGSMRSELGQQMRPSQLEVANKGRRELPVEPAAERLHCNEQSVQWKL